MLLYGQTVPAQRVPQDIVAMELQPGQLSLHHAHTLHRSRAFQGGCRRVGLALRCGMIEVCTVSHSVASCTGTWQRMWHRACHSQTWCAWLLGVTRLGGMSTSRHHWYACRCC